MKLNRLLIAVITIGLIVTLYVMILIVTVLTQRMAILQVSRMV